ncbi:MAG TPA: TonB-dependent receptor, partial [Gemmatimonadaceae bacterium]|nr:TonB-dependent receptor [Gemmatimonadaceae bacterium]
MAAACPVVPVRRSRSSRRGSAPPPWRHAALVPLLAVALAALAPAVHAQGTGAIAGSVLGAGDVPLAGARVQAFARGRLAGGANSRGDGAFHIEALTPGAYEVLVTRLGYQPRRDTVRVTAGETASLRVTLTAAATQLDQVVTSVSRSNEKILDAPASVSVVTAEQIEERPALTVVDNLRSVPGLDVAPGGLVQSAVVARGFNNVFSGTLLTLVDNRFASVPSLRVNVPFLFTTTSEDVERVEVLLGPAAALYGPNSANGVLHVITKSPFTSRGTTLTLDAGERSVVRGAARHAGVLGSTVGYKVTGEYMRGKDWRFHDPAEPATFPNTPNTPPERVGEPNVRDFDVEKWGAEARLDWRVAEDAEWINTYGVTQARSAVELTGANGAGQLRDWTIQSLQSRFRMGRLFAQVFANLSDAGNADSTDLGGTYLLRTGQPIVDQSRTLAAQLQHASSLGARQSFVYGVDYIFTNPRTGATINGRNEDDDNVNEIGGYVQSTTNLSPRWDLLLAARLDRHSRLDETFFSPRAAIVFKPSQEQNLRLTFNRAYSTPANFSFFLDLLQAGNVGGLPFNVRAVGGPEEGFRFRRDCAGGAGSLCMRSPFTPVGAGGPGQFVPANAAGYYPAALQVALQAGLRDQLINAGLSPAAADTTIGRLATFDATGANVGTRLIYLTSGAETSPAAVRDVPPLEASFTNVLELGYKGIFADRFRLATDVWYQRREKFLTPATNFTPNAMLDSATLATGLATHLAPVLGPAAAAVAPVVAGGFQRIPLGTVVPDSRVTTNGDLAFTYQTIDRAIELYGVDVAFDVLVTDAFTLLGTYSWVSDVEFPEIESGQRPLTLNAPDHKGALTLRYDHRPRNVSLELRGRYQNTFPVNSAVFVTGVPHTAPDGSTYPSRQPP